GWLADAFWSISAGLFNQFEKRASDKDEINRRCWSSGEAGQGGRGSFVERQSTLLGLTISAVLPRACLPIRRATPPAPTPPQWFLPAYPPPRRSAPPQRDRRDLPLR